MMAAAARGLAGALYRSISARAGPAPIGSPSYRRRAADHRVGHGAGELCRHENRENGGTGGGKTGDPHRARNRQRGLRRRQWADQRVHDMDRLRRGTRRQRKPSDQQLHPAAFDHLRRGYSSVGTTGIATSFTDVNPSGAETPQVFVGNGRLKTVHAVNTSTNAGTSIITGTIGIEPNDMAVTPDGTKVLVAEGASNQVQIITVATDKVAKTVAIPELGGTKSRPDAIAITPNGLTAYVVDGANNSSTRSRSLRAPSAPGSPSAPRATRARLS